MSYLKAHWRGELSLGISLWINLLGGMLLVSCVELLYLSYFAGEPASLLSRTLLSLLLTRLIIYPWQLIGFLRAVERDFLEYRQLLKSRALQGLALLSLLFTLVDSLDVIQSAVYYRHQLETYRGEQATVDYRLIVSPDGRELLVEGGLDIGITSAVRELLELHAGLESVVLDSEGGQIYEGRGLARVFMQHRLDTRVIGECSSACATAFIGGVHRSLGVNARLGFHQYKIDSSRHPRLIPIYDLRKEQERDRALYRARGIDETFLRRMFDSTPDQIWFPDHQQLLDARIVHRIVAVQPLQQGPRGVLK